MSNNHTWSTREAARFLDISTVALLRKTDKLGAYKDSRGWYHWPVERVKAYARAVSDKALTDPTRGQELER